MISDDEEMLVIDKQDLKDVCKFEQMYLIGKGSWQNNASQDHCVQMCCWLASYGEVNIIDLGNGASIIKFTNAVDCNKVFEGQLWSMEGQI